MKNLCITVKLQKIKLNSKCSVFRDSKVLLFTKMMERLLKGSVQMKNDLGLYCSLVLVMNIGMCDLVIVCLG